MIMDAQGLNLQMFLKIFSKIIVLFCWFDQDTQMLSPVLQMRFVIPLKMWSHALSELQRQGGAKSKVVSHFAIK